MEQPDYHSTVQATGKRRWLYPLVRKDAWYKYRNILSYFLLAFLFSAPFIKINGHQFILFNIIERKFILFGQVFWPQDFFILVMAILAFIVCIVLFTIVFGRIFCGWICPQTIFLEMVFRKIEIWIEGEPAARKKLDVGPWTNDKIQKKTIKHFLYLLISFAISNTFLAYIIGSDELFTIISEPIVNHWVGLTSLIIFTFVFYLVFSQLRELVCIVACPYGRLQGVLLDKNSLVVAYNYLRGEPRGKIIKHPNESTPILGDCVDCNLCVAVCPTGIDIREGTQLECVNCTACIDACNQVMEKTHRPKNLIGYYSDEMIKNGTSPTFTTTMKAYSFIIVLIFSVLIYFIATRKDVGITVLRASGMLYQVLPDGFVSNLYNAELVNKTSETIKIEIVPEDARTRIKWIQPFDKLDKEITQKVTFFVIVPQKEISKTKTELTLLVKQNGTVIDRIKTNFLGPVN